MLASKLPYAKVIVGKKRAESAKFAEKLAVDYIVMDDGMQHRYLHRDIEVVMTHCRPGKGLMRESPKRLRKADYVVVNGIRTEEEFQKASSDLRKYTEVPLIGVSYDVVNREEIASKTVGAFCGIGKPEEFYQLLEEMNCHVVQKETLADHVPFHEVEKFIASAMARGAEKIVCTEKDSIKLHAAVIPLKVELSVKFGKQHWEALCKNLSK